MAATRVFLESLGCKLNQAERDELYQQFAEAGCRMVTSITDADIYILNTCTVTHIADRKSRHLLRMAHRNNPDALLVATGCYVQRESHDLAKIDGVRFTFGNKDKPNILRVLADHGFIDRSVRGHPVESHGGFRTRAMLKIQDGCSYFCTYCIVPLVRGGERSRTAQEVIDSVNEKVAAGYRELVLTGVRIGSYYSNGVDLCGLLERILEETSVERLRLSSLQPGEISTRLITLWQDGRLCPHFHLCLQSGSDQILEMMGRRYSTVDFEQTVSSIRRKIPDVAITTDVMVGFPGESDEHFEQSYSFCQRIGFSRIHVFSYSPRNGTEASRYPDQVGDSVKKERADRMLKLAKDGSLAFKSRFLGRRVQVLFERVSRGLWTGLTPNYIRVYVDIKSDIANCLRTVELVSLYRDGVLGAVIK